MVLVIIAREVVDSHVEHLVAQLTRLIAGGSIAASSRVADAEAPERALFDATTRVHSSTSAAPWSHPGLDNAFEGVLALLLHGFPAC